MPVKYIYSVEKNGESIYEGTIADIVKQIPDINDKTKVMDGRKYKGYSFAIVGKLEYFSNNKYYTESPYKSPYSDSKRIKVKPIPKDVLFKNLSKKDYYAAIKRRIDEYGNTLITRDIRYITKQFQKDGYKIKIADGLYGKYKVIEKEG